MAGELALPSLEIHNFRGLRELKISRLGRANLIVGKNNVGKTSVLEAIQLHAGPGLVGNLLDILRSRYELSSIPRLSGRHPVDDPLPFHRLFHGQWKVGIDVPPIRIGPVDDPSRQLCIELRWRDYSSSGGNVSESAATPGEKASWDGIYALVFRLGGRESLLPIGDSSELFRMEFAGKLRGNFWDKYSRAVAYVGANGLRSDLQSLYWDEIALTDQEDDVLEAMNLISGSIERINFRGGSQASDQRVAYVKSADSADPWPLSSLGDGASRAFGIALALANARNGILLVDEFENGLHYSIQANLWRFLFEAASRLNVQVFATTHSSDCVEAFQIAVSENKENEGVLIRLSRRGDRIVATEFDEEDLEIAVEGNMELRG